MFVQGIFSSKNGEYRLKREVSWDQVISYQINDLKVSKEKYWENILKDLDINFQAFHAFCFSQGNLEFTPFMKGGKDLTELLEKISGSIDFKD